jgi:hypothetical protein
MADVYGAAGQNRFSIPNQVGFFSVEVNKESGVSQLYLQGPFATQQSVGTYNPSTKKFTPDPNSNLTQQQITRISSSEGIKAITTAATQTATKGIADGGTNSQAAQTEANKLLSPNTAAGSTVDSGQLSSAIGAGRKGTRDKFPGAAGTDPLKYPLTLKSEHQDVIKFKMVKYEPKKFSPETLGFAGRSAIRNIIGTVVLPIPAGISDANSVAWSDDRMNALEASAAAVALGFITEGGEGGATALEKVIGGVSNASEEVKKALAAAFTSSATGTSTAGILGRTTGAIINPNLELLFNAPSLRPFNFTFKLSARSKREAEAIRSIIRFFKQGMSPIRTESNLFLKAPHTFQLEYLHRGKQHNYLNRFKECALQSFSVDYTPEGQYATFTDGAMVSYQITMQFSELEPVFNDDYGNTSLGGDDNKDTQIGY